MALPSERIFLPSYLGGFEIHPFWKQFSPIFVVGGFSDFANMINGEFPSQNTATLTTTADDGGGRYQETADKADRGGLVYNRDSYSIEPNYTIFLVAKFPSSLNTSTRVLLGSGSNSGANKPFTYQVSNFNATYQVRFWHDNGPNGEQWKTGLNWKTNEISTVSFGVRNYDIECCVDGVTGSTTLSYLPAPAAEGTHALFFEQGGGNFSSDAQLYMAVVFDRFIPNNLMLRLHDNPASLFMLPYRTPGFVAAAGTTINCNLESLSITEFQANQDLDKNITTVLESLQLTEFQADQNLNKNITTNLESLAITEYQSALSMDITISANLESLQVTEYSANIALGVTIDTNLESLTITEFQADQDLDKNITTNLESLTLTENASTVSLGVVIDANLESLTITEFLSNTDLDKNITTNLESLSLTENASTAKLTYSIDCSVEALNITENGATIQLSKIVSAALESLGITENAATITFTGATGGAYSFDVAIHPFYESSITIHVFYNADVTIN